MKAGNGPGETSLGERLRAAIRRDGPMGVDAFMRVALQDPDQGYYVCRDAIGAGGDFITAPEISQMFGELVSMWMADFWRRSGRPMPMQLVELGPGRGTMIADILRAAGSVKGFREALRPVLVESNRVLAARQAGHPEFRNARWVASVGEVDQGPAIWLANEFFDALPIRQFVRARDGWQERQVAVDCRERLAWQTGPAVDLPLPLQRVLGRAAVGAVAEWSEASRSIMRRMAWGIRRFGGAALIIDYGYEEADLAAAGGGDTLQAVCAHRPVPVLEGIGVADLSAHVNFSSLARTAEEEGVRACPVVSQRNLLESIGIHERAAALSRGKPGSVRDRIEAARARLIDSHGMGSLFRALALHARNWPEPAGFGRHSSRCGGAP